MDHLHPMNECDLIGYQVLFQVVRGLFTSKLGLKYSPTTLPNIPQTAWHSWKLPPHLFSFFFSQDHTLIAVLWFPAFVRSLIY